VILLDTHARVRWLHPEIGRNLPEPLRQWLRSAEDAFAVSVISTLEVAQLVRKGTASEFKRREWGTPGFGSSLLRHALFAVYQAADREDNKAGLTYLKTEVTDYWTHRESLVALTGYLGRLSIPNWSRNAEGARFLAGALDNDHV